MGSDSSKISILTVEDDDDIRDLIVTQLRDKEYKVFEADSLTSAFGKLSNHNFDLLFFDLNLKNQSSSELIKYVRNNENTKNSKTPILIVSGEVDVSSFKVLMGNVSDVIVKPFSSAQLIEKVEALVGKPALSEPIAEEA